MGQNNKKYLDYAGLEKLVDMGAVVPHPHQTAVGTPGAYKVAFDEHGHITSTSALTAADLKLDTALHFIGTSSTDPATGVVTCAARPDNDFQPGDVCIYKRTKKDGDKNQGDFYDNGTDPETYYEEYIYTGAAWELLGDADSYALKDVEVEGDGTYILGGGDLSQDRTLSHKTYTAVAAGIRTIGRDSGGHVVIGKGIGVTDDGEFTHTHSHTTSTPIAKDTYVTAVNPTKTKLDLSQNQVKTVVTSVPGAFKKLETTSITGVSGSTDYSASKAVAGTAKAVATTGTAVVYGTADVGDTVTGLAKRAASQTNVGNANRATTATVIGNANVGNAVRYGTANVGTATRYGTADVGNAVSVATRAASNTNVGNANVGSTVSVLNDVSVKSITQPIATVSTKANNTAKDTFTAAVNGECLELTPVTISVSLSNVGVELETSSDEVTQAAASNTYIYGVGDVTDITPAVAAPSTQTLTPAVAAPSTQTLTPAALSEDEIYGAVDSSTYIYGVTADQVSVTSATDADTSRKIIPAVDNGTITPYTFTAVNFTVPTAATATIVATGDLTTTGNGADVMIGAGTLGTVDVLGKDTTIVSGTTGDVELVSAIEAPKNAAVTFTGSTDEDSFTHESHTHTLFEAQN
jgi:hypothetical protein